MNRLFFTMMVMMSPGMRLLERKQLCGQRGRDPGMPHLLNGDRDQPNPQETTTSTQRGSGIIREMPLRMRGAALEIETGNWQELLVGATETIGIEVEREAPSADTRIPRIATLELIFVLVSTCFTPPSIDKNKENKIID
jgi:hypothetical protein